MHAMPPALSAAPLSAADHLARLEAIPLRLTGGRPLQDWLTHETNLCARRGPGPPCTNIAASSPLRWLRLISPACRAR